MLTRIEGEKETGGKGAAAGEDTEHSIGDGPDIRGAGLHIGAVHLLKEGYQVTIAVLEACSAVQPQENIME